MRNFLIISLLVMGMFLCVAYAQVNPRLAGLADNAEYLSLLDDEARLRDKEDSLVASINDIRQRFREQPSNRDRFSNDILRLEGEIFDVRNNIGIIAGRINSIEQEYIIKNLITEEGDGQAPVVAGGPAARETSANLIFNPFFSENLSPADYSELVKAQRNETEVMRLAGEYGARYARLKTVADSYDTAGKEDADSIYQVYLTLYEEMEGISMDFGEKWDHIFDNKLFAYNYLLDKLNRIDLLTSMEKKVNTARETTAALRENSMDGNIASYPVNKAMMLDYEIKMAELLAFGRSADSLRKSLLPVTQLQKEYPRIELKERLFLDYADITFHSPAKYNSANPIPAIEVYEKGVIYRILLGTFQKAQPVSILKGAYPAGTLKEPDGRTSYYAGGYENARGAYEAVQELKKKGFRNPKIAEWNYGTLTVHDPDKFADNGDHIYMVELTVPGDALPAAIRELIGEAAPGKEISRVGNKFAVGPFQSMTEAEDLADAIEDEDERITVKINATEV